MARKSRKLRSKNGNSPSISNSCDVVLQSRANNITNDLNEPDSISCSESGSDIEALVDQTLLKVGHHDHNTDGGVRLRGAPESDFDCFTIDKTLPTNSILPNTKSKEIAETSDTDFEDDFEEHTECSKSNLAPGTSKQKQKDEEFALSSALDAGEEVNETYLNVDPYRKPEERNIKIQKILLKQGDKDDIMKKNVIGDGVEKQFTLPEYEQSLRQQRKQRKAARDQTKGSSWFNMEAPEMTDEKKNDLMVLQMRHVLNPKHFYKAPDIRALPKYFEMGTIQENATDFYSGRVPKKERKKTLVGELLEDSEFRRFNKRKYAEIQEAKMKGTGAYKRMKRLKKKKK